MHAVGKYLEEEHPTEDDSRVCIGFHHESEYVYDYMLNFATQFKDDPFFGLFWGSSFTHDDWTDLHAMDLRVKTYLERLDKQGILNNSAVLFISDHGDRYGSLRSASVNRTIHFHPEFLNENKLLDWTSRRATSILLHITSTLVQVKASSNRSKSHLKQKSIDDSLRFTHDSQAHHRTFWSH
jgi:hypothetical protein